MVRGIRTPSNNFAGVDGAVEELLKAEQQHLQGKGGRNGGMHGHAVPQKAALLGVDSLQDVELGGQAAGAL